ncbi:TraB/GumN family protein [Aureibaculum sp. 2210JD6-5]|uniref:TraB/GumN family protein n=1 Tax=Aureibaculum sp. 2210JD6-5 TaxID=3103957 RepID=UPI002AACC060|nr:TraB/GumN family protein [Aureibaculum sp. 2210JD6-5]MDY7394820.1 TraB/GumN family protein [Aureibaculum sp. 2210JD6-5]
MKNHIIISLTLLYLLISNANAQDNNSLLWKIEGDNIQTSYIFGTIHMLPQKDFVMSQKVKDAFAETEELYLELDMDNPEMMQEMMKQMMIEETDLLSNHVDSTEYKLLDSYLKENVGMGFAQFNRFKPLYMSSTIMSSLVGKQVASYEFTFMSMAKEAKKELKGLETVEDQMSVFDSISYEDQMDELVEMLEDPNDTKELYSKMVEKYKSENINDLFDYMDDFFDNDQKMIDKLLYDRNENWVKKIPEISKDKKILYAVGAGHLGGEKGVIQLLKNQGFKVTPVLD